MVLILQTNILQALIFVRISPTMFTEIFPQMEINYNHCRAEVLKLSYMALKLYLVWDQKYGIFHQRN